ncbi:formylglycine-generating enzyme family protein [Ameyamaea chiangmaiensis]|uniref:Formylglycine-generating enzyme family protein n=2 Tax=Ameyamaea chiangmaiensis TaxID=442969 RepID=A0A850P9H4_9PROT|nr:formylglycine-generating enzyme family protein [Ameyamaea chiangmaiensis]
MVRLCRGRFLMGSDRHYPEEAPRRVAEVDDFLIDEHPVTNAQFAHFVAETGYRTFAETPPDPDAYPGLSVADAQAGSAVFVSPPGPVPPGQPAAWWRFIAGACWRHPEGPDSTIEDRATHPVVQIAYEDAQAYAHWAGKALPTEAEWEYAARGGLEGAEYAWGDELAPGGHFMANYWQGRFPWENTLEDGFARTSPIGAFPANPYGLHDMIGNVWEWTTDWFTTRTTDERACCGPPRTRPGTREESLDPSMPPALRTPRKVVKGGSHLCAPNYCRRYRPAARYPQATDSPTSHIGFRCIKRL